MGKCRADVRAVTEDLFYRQRTLTNQLGEGTALDILHGDKYLASVFTHFVDRADIWMIQSRSSTRLVFKTFIDLVCVRHRLRKKLERYGPMKSGVFRSIY